MTSQSFWLTAGAWCVFAGSAQACATLGGTGPKSPECSDEQLAKIEAAYIAEATETCAGKTYDGCEELPTIREKYQAKREAWKLCSK
jgi:hypothetical protein